jgi:phenylacetate-CoA ligase
LYGLLKRAYWPTEKLKEYQDKRLRKVVRYAYDSVPFYHDWFNKAGVKPHEISTAADLSKLPILRKDEIRNNVDRIISRDFDRAKLRLMYTSGSTGKPLGFYISGKEDEYRKTKHLRANIGIGQKPRDKWAVISSAVHVAEAKGLQRRLGIYVPTPVVVFNDIDKQISALEELQPDILGGYSCSLWLLAKEIEKRGTLSFKPRFIIGGAEYIAVSSRQYIEKVFGVPFYDQYAADEMERIAWQCKEKNEYHIDADSIVVQFVDKKGQDVAVGERGEIVCTSLFNYAMPFIRYAVGDVGIPSSGKCSCGRSLPLMKILEGRTDSFLVLSDGRTLSPMAFDATMDIFPLQTEIYQYRIVQRKIGVFEFVVQPSSDRVDKETMAKELEEHFRKTLMIGRDQAKFDVKFVDSIPLDEGGKLRKVVSELYQNPMTKN